MVCQDEGGITKAPETARVLQGRVMGAGQMLGFVQANWLGTPRKSQRPYMWKEHTVAMPLRQPRAKTGKWGGAGGVATGGVSGWVCARL